MPNVTITTDNKTITVEEDCTLIEMCKTNRTSILFGCQDGQCGACLIHVTKNPENLSLMEEKEKEFLECMAVEPDCRLACQCKVKGNVTIEGAD